MYREHESIFDSLHWLTDISLNLVSLREGTFSCVENKHRITSRNFHKYKF